MIRKFVHSDEARAAAIWLKSGQEEYTYLPKFQALDAQKALHVFHEVISLKCDIWLVTNEECIQGFIALQGSCVDRLYIDPKFQRLGLGTALIQYAKEEVPTGLELHTHQENKRACNFYEKLGFKAVKYGISPAPELVPDVEYHWRP